MNIIIFKQIFALTFSFLLTFYFIPIVANIARRLNLVDAPDDGLKRHKKATPYLGGVAVYCGFLAALALVFPFENHMFLFY